MTQWARVCALAALVAGASATANTRPKEDGHDNALHNVLIITVDDLRVQINASYGMNMTATPNIDRLALADGSTTFLRAYCQMAVCSPSRNSFMTGRRPDTTQVWNFVDSFRDPRVGENWTTMPECVCSVDTHAAHARLRYSVICTWSTVPPLADQCIGRR